MEDIRHGPGRTPLDFGFQYAGLLLFMIGDGVEVGYLSPYLVSLGMNEHHVALLFTVYGLTAAMAAWASGVLCDVFGSRRVIVAGIVLWIVPQGVFLAYAIPHRDAASILLSYGIRGAGYPLLAYGILTLIMKEVRQERRGFASGLFWFCFTCGLPTMGTIIAQLSLPLLGEYRTLWLAFGAVLAGGALALVSLVESPRPPASRRGSAVKGEQIARLVIGNPSLVLTCVARAINSSATHGIIVFMPLYFINDAGMTKNQWMLFLEVIFVSNIVFNVVFGALSDLISWTRTVIWVGGVGSGLTCLLLYWVPHLYGHASPLYVYLTGALFGLALAGYVPLSAMAPSLLPANPGLAMSFLNFGAGCSVWLGPLVVYVFQPYLGVAGVIYIYSGLFFLSGLLVSWIRVPTLHTIAPRNVSTIRLRA